MWALRAGDWSCGDEGRCLLETPGPADMQHNNTAKAEPPKARPCRGALDIIGIFLVATPRAKIQPQEGGLLFDST